MYYLSFFDMCPLTSSMYMQTKSMARLHPPIRQKDRIPVNRLGGVELGMGVIIPDNIDCVPNKQANEGPYNDVQSMIELFHRKNPFYPLSSGNALQQKSQGHPGQVQNQIVHIKAAQKGHQLQ